MLTKVSPEVPAADNASSAWLSQGVSFVSDSRDPFVRYGARLLADFCRVKLVDASIHAKKVDLYYGNDRSIACGMRIPAMDDYRLETVPRLPSLNDFSAAHGVDSTFPFDFFQALYFWLSDQANSNVLPQGYDIHERLQANYSAQHSLGLREVPIVNHYLLLMRQWLRSRCGLACPSFLPDGKKCIVILSHDVDRPIDPTNFSHPCRLSVQAVKRLDPHLLFNCLRDGSRALIRRVSGCHDRFDVFEEILRAEDKFGFRSTFFFSPVSYVEGDHRFDVLYDLDTPRLRQVVKVLKAGGWEIGAHLSYNARNGYDGVAHECSRVEQFAHCRVRGSRHHYWHVGHPFWETLQEHERAGLAYDSSLAFNDAPGYRLGIAYPFRPWNPLTQCSIATLQIPTVFMDGNYFYEPGQTAEDAVDRLLALVEKLKEAEGIAAIDWHEHTAFPGSEAYGEWGRAYLLLLERLAADKSIAVCSFAEMLEMRNQQRFHQQELNYQRGGRPSMETAAIPNAS